MRSIFIFILGGVLFLGCPAPKTTNPKPDATNTEASDSAPTDDGAADSQPDNQPENEKPPVVVGGYSAADVKNADVQAAASKAIPLLQEKYGDKSISLKSIKAAESQVVAGTNYRMTLELTTKSGAKEVKVVVYRDLKDNYTLTSAD
jgi:hypothetical protein